MGYMAYRGGTAEEDCAEALRRDREEVSLGSFEEARLRVFPRRV